MEYDIVIVGGGPAGTTLARLLPEGFKVLLIDTKSHSADGGFKKPCGGLLAPDAQKSLGKFGLTLPLEIMVSPQIFAVETLDLNNNLKQYYQRFYLNIDRHKFDLWLISLIPKHISISDNSRCCNLEKTDSGYLVSYVKNGETTKVSARYVIGADGAKSIVREKLVKKPIRQYLSIQSSFKTTITRPYYVCFFDNDKTDCYGWINIKNNIVQLGGAFPVKTAKRGFAMIKEHFQAKGYPFENEVLREACLVNRPKSIGEVSLGTKDVFLIGETAGFISTSSLEGISFAMDSAAILAKAFSQKGSVLRNYDRLSRGLRLKVFSKILKSPFIYNKFLRKIVMKSGITALKQYK